MFINTPYETTVPERDLHFRANGLNLLRLQVDDNVVVDRDLYLPWEGLGRNGEYLARGEVVLEWHFFCLACTSTPVGTTIFRNVQAQDKDAGVNGLVEYFVVEGSQQNISDISPNTLTAADGYGVFAIAYPHQGQ
ncbi:hypothetical protein pipiens_020295, partial [Culex pipiens pipiens]